MARAPSGRKTPGPVTLRVSVNAAKNWAFLSGLEILGAFSTCPLFRRYLQIASLVVIKDGSHGRKIKLLSSGGLAARGIRSDCESRLAFASRGGRPRHGSADKLPGKNNSAGRGQVG